MSSPTSKNTQAYREPWLIAALMAVREYYKSCGCPLPDMIRIGVGFTTRGKRGKAMGECHVATNSADGTVEIIISPQIADPVLVLKELLSQLVLAAAHYSSPRKGREYAIAIGFTGPKRNMEMNPRLAERVNALTAALGPYPHASLNVHGLEIPVETTVLGAPPKQKARMLKVICNGGDPDAPCAFKVRVPASGLSLVACRKHGGDGIQLAAVPDPRRAPIQEAAE